MNRNIVIVIIMIIIGIVNIIAIVQPSVNTNTSQTTIDSLKQEINKKDSIISHPTIHTHSSIETMQEAFYKQELKECIKSNNNLMNLLNKTRDTLSDYKFKVDVLTNN